MSAKWDWSELPVQTISEMRRQVKEEGGYYSRRQRGAMDTYPHNGYASYKRISEFIGPYRRHQRDLTEMLRRLPSGKMLARTYAIRWNKLASTRDRHEAELFFRDLQKDINKRAVWATLRYDIHGQYGLWWEHDNSGSGSSDVFNFEVIYRAW